jgi:hypothetical protein
MGIDQNGLAYLKSLHCVTQSLDHPGKLVSLDNACTCWMRRRDLQDVEIGPTYPNAGYAYERLIGTGNLWFWIIIVYY